ncbi:MAG TPA: hypothetical protein VMR70_17905, partial [Flavisolibacter sp.]|nr:hypothetical protein [Flavisolibacter sp.]
MNPNASKPKLLFYLFICLFCLPSFLAAQTNDCASAPLLNSAPTCSNTAGTLTTSATYTTIPSPCTGSNRDVWYRFVANSVNPTITITTGITNIRLQLYSGTCAALTSVACGNASITASNLALGDTYYIRIYSSTNATGNFNICITDPAPANNLCGSAVVLT